MCCIFIAVDEVVPAAGAECAALYNRVPGEAAPSMCGQDAACMSIRKGSKLGQLLKYMLRHSVLQHVAGTRGTADTVELASQLFEYFVEDPRVFGGDSAPEAALKVGFLRCQPGRGSGSAYHTFLAVIASRKCRWAATSDHQTKLWFTSAGKSNRGLHACSNMQCNSACSRRWRCSGRCCTRAWTRSCT